MINVVILGSTGSIGTQTLEVIGQLSGFSVLGLAAGSNGESFSRQLIRWQPRLAAMKEKDRAQYVEQATGVRTNHGPEALLAMVQDPDVDLVVNALVGAAGLAPTLAALRAGKRVALANKETLVVGGPLVMEYRDQLIPIDSEHSAIWQCLEGHDRQHVEKLVLTASGGPFSQYRGNFEDITPKQALKHPNWEMGGKITIDSATLMNKGLEVIEAHWLFGFSYESIDVVVHPQSIVHSLIQMRDGSFLAHLGAADMRLPIQYALTYPERQNRVCAPLDLTKMSSLEFLPPDFQRFPCLELAYDAGRRGGTAPIVLNAANEIAVERFLKGKLSFPGIARLVEWALRKYPSAPVSTLEAILDLDAEVRITASEYGQSLQ